MKKILFLIFAVITSISAFAQDDVKKGATNSPGPTPVAPAVDTTIDSVLVTIIFKYDQNKTFVELRRLLEANGFWDLFPPAESRVVSWNVALGLGHIVTLKMPAGAVRRLYLAITNGAWGAFNAEVYMSYEYMPIWKDYMERREEAKEDRD